MPLFHGCPYLKLLIYLLMATLQNETNINRKYTLMGEPNSPTVGITPSQSGFDFNAYRSDCESF